MNQIGLRFRDAPPGPVPPPGGEAVDLDRVIGVLRRQAVPVALAVAAAMALAILYLATTPRSYFAASTVLVDGAPAQIVQQITAFEARVQSDATLLNEVEVIRSHEIAAAVADRLDLAGNQAFLSPRQSLLAQGVAAARGAVRGLLPLPAAPAPAEDAAGAGTERAAAIRSLQRQVVVERLGRSYVLMIGFSAQDPALAADIANAYAEAYLADQLNANFDATERTTLWLQERLADLEADSRDAARAVEQFREEHGLAASEGRLITERNLAQLNTELATAVAEAARARALAGQYAAVRDAGDGEGLAQRVLSLDATEDLRLAGLQERISALSARLGQIEAEFGPEHPQARAVAAELAGQTEAAYREAGRLAGRYAGDAATAAARETALRGSVAEASSVNAAASTLGVELRALEQRADALAALYTTYLTRFEEIDQQKSFPVSSVRILSPAGVPASASSPSVARVMAAALLLGLLAGAAAGGVREHGERFFRSGEDVTAETGLPFLGYLPNLTRVAPPGRLARLFRRSPSVQPPAAEGSRPDGQIEFHAVAHPRSQYSETLRNLRIAADAATAGSRHRVIGITSALPREGKTTLSLNLAGLLASAGQPTLLIDADLRNPGLTRTTGVRGGLGIVDALAGNADWKAARLQIGTPRLHFIPCAARAFVSHTGDLLGSQAMQKLIAEAGESYNYVILDLPPLGPVVDTRAVLPHLSALFLLAEWGRTPKGLLRQILASDPRIAERAAGMVLNKVDVESLRDYTSPSGAEHYQEAYSRYYSGE